MMLSCGGSNGVFTERVVDASENFFPKSDGYGVTQLPHVFRPGPVKHVSVGERLETAGFPNSEITYATIRIAQHVFSSGNSVVASLERFSGKVQGTAGVARIGTRASLKDVVWNGCAPCVPSRFAKIAYRVSNGAPWLSLAFAKEPQSIFALSRKFPCRRGPRTPGYGVPVPIFFAYELGNKKSVPRVCWIRKRPCLFQIGPNTNDKNSFSTLGNAVVGRIEKPKRDFILQIRNLALGVNSLKATKMTNPLLVVSFRDGGIRQLQNDIIEVFRERLTSEALYVLENECLRTRFTNDPNRFGKKVSIVGRTAVFAANRKGLARGSAGYDINATVPFSEIDRVNIGFDQRPIHNGGKPAALVRAYGVARVRIQFHHGLVLESQIAGAQCQSAGPGEKFDAFHVCSPFKYEF